MERDGGFHAVNCCQDIQIALTSVRYKAVRCLSRFWFAAATLACALSAPFGTWAQASKDVVDFGAAPMSELERLQPGQRVRFVGFDGKTYEAIFTGERQLGGPGQPDRFGIISVEEVGPSQAGSAGAQQGNTSTSRGGGASGATESGVSTGGGAAAAAAAATLAGYIAVPPSLRNELRERAGALQDAIRSRQAAIELYTATLSDTVAGARASVATLAAAARGTEFTFPATVSQGIAAMPDFGGAPSQLRRSLEASFVSLTTLPVPTPAHAAVRATGIHAIAHAQQSIKLRELAQAEAAAKLAAAAASVLRTAGDLFIGLNPLTALARDATELITGRDLLTGATLSSGELWMRGLSLGVGLVTTGVGSSVGQALSRIAPVIDSASEGRKLLDYTMEIGQHIRARWWRAGKVMGGVSEASDKTIRDIAFEAITKGDAYWDIKERTTAFFIRHEQSWLQVALDVKQGKAVTVVNRKIDYDFSNVIKTDEGLARRFIPLDEVSLPSSTSPSGSIRLFLPGLRSSGGR